MIDYEQLYYDALYEIKELKNIIKDLEDEIEILKGDKNLIEYIIQKINERKKNENKN